jgi:hypothetical protein
MGLKCCGWMMKRERIKGLNKKFTNFLELISTFKDSFFVLFRVLFFISTSIDGDDVKNKEYY